MGNEFGYRVVSPASMLVQEGLRIGTLEGVGYVRGLMDSTPRLFAAREPGPLTDFWHEVLDQALAVLTTLMLEIEQRPVITEATMPCALLLGGPHDGKLIPINGPFEFHFEGGDEYQVIDRGKNTWRFPLRYRYVEK